MYVMSLNYTLKMVKMINFILCLFYYNKQKFLTKGERGVKAGQVPRHWTAEFLIQKGFDLRQLLPCNIERYTI